MKDIAVDMGAPMNPKRKGAGPQTEKIAEVGVRPRLILGKKNVGTYLRAN